MHPPQASGKRLEFDPSEVNFTCYIKCLFVAERDGFEPEISLAVPRTDLASHVAEWRGFEPVTLRGAGIRARMRVAPLPHSTGRFLHLWSSRPESR